MPLTIKNVIEKFDNQFVDKISGDMWQTTSREEIKQFLQEELTLMLDGILDEMPPISYTRDMKSTYRNEYRQEVINIINLHR